MSKARLDDLLHLLHSQGWEILNEHDHLRYSDPYDVENEIVTWGIIHYQKQVFAELEFFLFGDLGQRTEDLNDISYCSVKNRGIRLYFKKRNREEWPCALNDFVHALAALPAGEMNP